MCAAGLLVVSCTSENDATRLGLLGDVKTVADTTILITSKDRAVQIKTLVEFETRTFTRSGSQNSYHLSSTAPTDTITVLLQQASILESKAVQPIYFETHESQKLWGSLSTTSKRPTEIICRDSKGAEDGKIINTSDSDGHLLTSVYYDATGTAGARYTYVNDGKGRPTEIVCYDPEGNQKRKLTYQYDTQGKIQEYIHLGSDGRIIRKHSFQYNAAGHPTSIIYEAPANNLQHKITYAYQYDTQGNWTIRDQHLNGTHIKHTQRTITYY